MPHVLFDPMNGFMLTTRTLRFRSLLPLILALSLCQVGRSDEPGLAPSPHHPPAATGNHKPGSLQTELERILSSHGQGKVKLGARVVDLSSGRVILDLNGEQPM